MNGAGCRRKGHDFERWVAKELRAIFPGARRGLQYQDGVCPPDVLGTPYHIECKKGKRTDIKAAMLQAGRDSGVRNEQKLHGGNGGDDLLPPVAITKDDDKPALVTMGFDTWVAMLEAIYGRRGTDIGERAA